MLRSAEAFEVDEEGELASLGAVDVGEAQGLPVPFVGVDECVVEPAEGDEVVGVVVDAFGAVAHVVEVEFEGGAAVSASASVAFEYDSADVGGNIGAGRAAGLVGAFERVEAGLAADRAQAEALVGVVTVVAPAGAAPVAHGLHDEAAGEVGDDVGADGVSADADFQGVGVGAAGAGVADFGFEDGEVDELAVAVEEGDEQVSLDVAHVELVARPGGHDEEHAFNFGVADEALGPLVGGAGDGDVEFAGTESDRGGLDGVGVGVGGAQGVHGGVPIGGVHGTSRFQVSWRPCWGQPCSSKRRFSSTQQVGQTRLVGSK